MLAKLASYTQVIPKMMMGVTGMSEKTCSVIFAVSIVVVLSFCFNFIEEPEYRKWYSSAIGMSLYFYWMGIAYIFSLAMFMMLCIVIKNFNGKQAYYVGNTLSFLALSVGNIYRYCTNNGIW